MMWLVVFAAALAMLTTWFLIRPLGRARTVVEGQYQLTQLRDRLLAQLRELDVEIGDDNIDAAVAGDERLRLEAELARVLKEIEKQPGGVSASTGTNSRKLFYLASAFVIVVPLTAAGLYFGSHYGMLAQLGNTNSDAAKAADVPPMVLEMVGRLEQRLRTQPNDAKGWAQLGRSYEVLSRNTDADAAYRKAYRLAPNDPQILALYGGYLLSAGAGSIPQQEAIAVFVRWHRLEPQDPGALWGLGLFAYQGGEYAKAVGYWQNVLKVLPANDPARGDVQRAIDTAQAQRTHR